MGSLNLRRRNKQTNTHNINIVRLSQQISYVVLATTASITAVITILAPPTILIDILVIFYEHHLLFYL